jgi:hypothetical protein
MTDRIKEIDDLFSMFHDFEIVELELAEFVLNIKIRLPWAEMWKIEDYKMTFVFYGCSHFQCHYFKRISNELKKWENGVYYPSEEHITNELGEIEKLELAIQSHDFEKPDKFILHCNSSTSFGNKIGQIDFARIELGATDYKIYDNESNEMTLDKMKEWGTQWWDKIQKMWDEQK